jgi:hypothetical protein
MPPRARRRAAAATSDNAAESESIDIETRITDSEETPTVIAPQGPRAAGQGGVLPPV